MKLESYIRDVRDFPKPGIVFKDITPLLASPDAFRIAIDGLAGIAESLQPDAIVAIESRGFWFGAPLAVRLGLPFVPVRKPGKLPAAKLREEYALEYGTDALEIHSDALPAGARTLIVDDVLATGRHGSGRREPRAARRRRDRRGTVSHRDRGARWAGAPRGSPSPRAADVLNVGAIPSRSLS